MPEDKESPEQKETNHLKTDHIKTDHIFESTESHLGQGLDLNTEENPDFIFSKQGAPFKTEQAARNTIRLKKLDQKRQRT